MQLLNIKNHYRLCLLISVMVGEYSHSNQGVIDTLSEIPIAGFRTQLFEPAIKSMFVTGACLGVAYYAWKINSCIPESPGSPAFLTAWKNRGGFSISHFERIVAASFLVMVINAALRYSNMWQKTYNKTVLYIQKSTMLLSEIRHIGVYQYSKRMFPYSLESLIDMLEILIKLYGMGLSLNAALKQHMEDSELSPADCQAIKKIQEMLRNIIVEQESLMYLCRQDAQFDMQYALKKSEEEALRAQSFVIQNAKKQERMQMDKIIYNKIGLELE